MKVGRIVAFTLLGIIGTLVILNNTGALRYLVGLFDLP